MTDILLSGFGPFLNHIENPTEQLALEFDGLDLRGLGKVQSLILPVDFHTCFPILAQKLQEIVQTQGKPPRYIVCLGLQNKATHFHLEKLAINLQHSQVPDNANVHPRAKKICLSGPNAYFTSLPVEDMVEALNGEYPEHEPPPFKLSISAGSYVCNTLYYQTLDYLQQSQDHYPNTRALFCHLPNIGGDFSDFPLQKNGQRELLEKLLRTLLTLEN